jgi:hypothetical protein
MLQEPHGIASQKTAFFIVTVVKTWNHEKSLSHEWRKMLDNEQWQRRTDIMSYGCSEFAVALISVLF